MVVKEALNNVAKHAGATSVCLSLALADGTLVIAIEDDGRDAHKELDAAMLSTSDPQYFGVPDELEEEVMLLDEAKVSLDRLIEITERLGDLREQ